MISRETVAAFSDELQKIKEAAKLDPRQIRGLEMDWFNAAKKAVRTKPKIGFLDSGRTIDKKWAQHRGRPRNAAQRVTNAKRAQGPSAASDASDTLGRLSKRHGSVASEKRLVPHPEYGNTWIEKDVPL